MKEKLNAVFEALKELDMKPTPPNVSIMSGVYDLLRQVYHKLEEVEQDAGRENGAEADPGGQDSD